MAAASPQPPKGLSKTEMRERLERFSDTTGCGEEETLQMLISCDWCAPGGGTDAPGCCCCCCCCCCC